ncbi:Ima1 N-terminal domain-containing protein [Collybia nuda]|uniref:Ima1 N-terminal domain-containing protein n=1 Tax=Collybia nuda TaxID=64659 RepID=A0A9P6CDT7_9AGAR|nr:Ima1 N-terminal domain-containing protein [Collybia nuda]
MSGLFRRPSTRLSCFFCQSSCPPVRDSRNFWCPSCGCWNRYDEKGDILSDEPAMHDESMNSIAFAKRASPNKNQLPTMYGKGPFCHTCQTNQMLHVHLLSNYLPPPNNPEYRRRLEALPEYKDSLQARYPPVCESCFPAVEDEIRRKDTMARTKALGGWLKESKGKEKQRRVSETYKELDKVGAEIMAWRARGVLWLVSLSITFVSNLGAALGARPLYRLSFMLSISPFMVLLSLFWSMWDPTYSSVQRAQRQGRNLRVQGKNMYIKIQMLAWLSRLCTSCLVVVAWHWPNNDILHIHQPMSSRSRLYFAFSWTLELAILVISCLTLRIQQPPAIRLLDSNFHQHMPSRSTTPSSRLNTPTPLTTAEPDILSSLSLSSKPIISTVNPVFGHSSLTRPLNVIEALDADAMDWTPTNVHPATQNPAKANESEPWLRPQRFFAPENPTGLEGLFERTLLVDDTPKQVLNEFDSTAVHQIRGYRWYLLILVAVIAMGYKLKDMWMGNVQFNEFL